MTNIANLLTEHIAIWTAADTEKKSGRGRASGNAGSVYGVKKLRELILELAVRGKLVPQDPNDEPASELLKRIKAKTDKPLTLINQNSYELPEGWEWVHFGEIAQHNSGKTLDKGRNSGVLRDYITTSNLYWGKFELDSIKQMPIEESELERCSARMNDLLICEGGEAGRAAVWTYDKEVCFQNHVHRARLYEGIDHEHFSIERAKRMLWIEQVLCASAGTIYRFGSTRRSDRGQTLKRRTFLVNEENYLVVLDDPAKQGKPLEFLTAYAITDLDYLTRLKQTSVLLETRKPKRYI